MTSNQILAPLLCAIAMAAQGAAPPAASPQTQPPITGRDVTFVGAFTLPSRTSPSEAVADFISYGGFGLGLGADRQSLYVGCHDYGDKLARVTIPAPGAASRVVEPCTAIPRFAEISGAGGRENGLVVGGSLWYHGRLIVSGYTYYDASAGTPQGHNRTHFAGGPGVGDLAGPWRVGTDGPGLVAGNMAVVPDEWRAAIGGPVIGGLCCIPVISRSSYGPSIHAFDPDDLGRAAAVRSTMLAGYPEGHATLGAYESAGEFYGMAMTMGGLAWPRGSRSVLAIVNRPTTYCYGQGTADPALDGTPVPDTQGAVHYCYNTLGNTDKASHSRDYELSLVVFDANDLAAVKAGRRRPWEVRPTARLRLPKAPTTTVLQSATFDPESGRLYVAPAFKGEGTIYVWRIAVSGA